MKKSFSHTFLENIMECSSLGNIILILLFKLIINSEINNSVFIVGIIISIINRVIAIAITASLKETNLSKSPLD